MGRKEKILVYGCGEIYQKNQYWIPTIYDVLGIVDRKWERSDAGHGRFTIKEGIRLNFERVLVTTGSSSFGEIKKFLIETYDISPEKIIHFLDEFSEEREMSFGNENPEICFYILRAHWQESSNGFYNFFNRAVRTFHYAKKNDYEFLIDMKHYYTEYAGTDNYGKYNVWENYYEQPSHYSLEEAYRSKNVIFSKFGTEWDKERIGDIFGDYKEKYLPFIEIGKLYASFFCVSSVLAERIQNEKERLNWGDKRILGVLMRGTDFNKCPPRHPVIHPINDVINDVLNKMESENYDLVYLATEDSRILNLFRQRIRDKLIYSKQYRTDQSDRPLMKVKFPRDNDGYLRGLEYCTVIEMLSACNSIVANCMCGGTMAALTRNQGKYEAILVYDDGFYK